MSNKARFETLSTLLTIIAFLLTILGVLLPSIQEAFFIGNTNTDYTSLMVALTSMIATIVVLFVIFKHKR